MNKSLSDLVDTLSQIYKKECKGCKERRKIKSEYDIFGIKIINYYVKNVKNVKKIFETSKRINQKVS